ncbi:hypothetical protein L195_g021599 [Trifolium pratense]|uniref:Uncharacterized protein n=1 Tax=Trifolium pratense TaxID=57577 RepID=A0A2K3N5Q8_TRIPR|nr:hypothetical protein L195_g021599 [Trifolium pratense]
MGMGRELFYQCRLVKQLKKFDTSLVNEEVRLEVLTAGILTKMHIINTKLVQPKHSFEVNSQDPFYLEDYPIISELDCEEVIQNFLATLRYQGHNVTRDMVPPAPTADPHGARRKGVKRKAYPKEKVVKTDLLKQKKIKVEKEAEKRTNQKHEVPAKKVIQVSTAPQKRKLEFDDPAEDSSETDTDDQTIAARLRRGKKAPVDKGKSSKITTETDSELGYTKPLQTILPENTIKIDISSSDTNSEELNKSTDELLSKGESFMAKTTSANKSQKLDEPVSSDTPLKELEKHLSSDTLNTHTFTHEMASTTPQPHLSPAKQPLNTPQDSPTKPSSEPKPDDDNNLPAQSSDPQPDDESQNLLVQSSEQQPDDNDQSLPDPSSDKPDVIETDPTNTNLLNKFFIFPSDVDVVVSPFKAKLGDVLDIIAQEVKDDIGNKVAEARKAEVERSIQLAKEKFALIERAEAEKLEQEKSLLNDMAELIVSPDEFSSSSSGKGKAPMDPSMEEKFKALEDAIGTQRSDHQQLEGKVDNLDNKVDGLHEKFDKLLALFSSKP